MGAGIQRWWSDWSHAREMEEYERRTKPKSERYSAPGMRQWWGEFFLTETLSREEVEKMFPHPRANEGFELLCVQHGIYGLRARGDKCGACRRTEAFMMSDGVFETAPDPKPLRIGAADIKSPSQETMDRLNGWFAKKYEPIAEAARADRETAASLAAAINAPLDPWQQKMVERFAGQRGGKILIASTPAGPSTVFNGIRFEVDERLAPHEHYVLPTKAWRDAVNQNKESNMAQVTDMTLKEQLDAALETLDRMRSEGLYLGNGFRDPMFKLMKNMGAFSDEQFAQRVDRLLALERGDVEALFDLAESAWGVIANASGGDWHSASAAWREAAGRWRDRYYALLNVRAKQVIEIRDGKCTACGLFTQAGHEPGNCPGQKFETVRALDAAGFIPKAVGIEKILGEPPGESFLIPIPTGEEAIRQGFCFAGGPPMPGEPGRAGDQLRKCHGCDKEQKVDDFNLSIAPHTSSGCFGDAEDLYICDACAPDMLKAVRRVREGKLPARPEPLDLDLIAGDA